MPNHYGRSIYEFYPGVIVSRLYGEHGKTHSYIQGKVVSNLNGCKVHVYFGPGHRLNGQHDCRSSLVLNIVQDGDLSPEAHLARLNQYRDRWTGWRRGQMLAMLARHPDWGLKLDKRGYLILKKDGD